MKLDASTGIARPAAAALGTAYRVQLGIATSPTTGSKITTAAR